MNQEHINQITNAIGAVIADAVKAEVDSRPPYELDYETIAEKVNVAEVASEISLSDLASEICVGDIANEISVSDLTEDIASNIDLSSLGREMFDERTDDIIEAVMEKLDYKLLASALLEEMMTASKSRSEEVANAS